MNLWVKRTGQLLLAALFLMACEDENSLLGFKNPISRFEVKFVEIPVQSSVILLDSFRTANFFDGTEPDRFLLGTYQDDRLGQVSSTIYTQFFTTLGIKVSDLSFLDSITLQLQYDFSLYGSAEKTPQQIAVYELDQKIINDSIDFYYNTSTRDLGNLVGTKNFTIDPEEFKKYQNKDTVVTLNLQLDFNYGLKIFDIVRDYSQNPNTDSAFIKFDRFVEAIKGLGIVPLSGDKIIGLIPNSPNSLLKLHYHSDTEDSLVIDFSFLRVGSFNGIISDRATTELAGLTQPFQDFHPASGFRYCQSGVAIFTKIDVTDFFSFADTVKNAIINSAELVIEQVEDPGSLTPPQSLKLIVLDNTNRFKVFKQKAKFQEKIQNQKDLELFQNTIRLDGESVFTVADDFFAILRLNYSTQENRYIGFPTLFMQELLTEEPGKTKFSQFLLFPENPIANKNVNRVAFHKDGIKLRIYYTTPTLIQ